jgi:hypothetical protein
MIGAKTIKQNGTQQKGVPCFFALLNVDLPSAIRQSVILIKVSSVIHQWPML